MFLRDFLIGNSDIVLDVLMMKCKQCVTDSPYI